MARPEGKSGTTAFVFTISLSDVALWPVTVAYRSVNGTALTTSDYTAVSSTAYFAIGTKTKTVTVWVKGDRTKEKNETFNVYLSNPSANADIADAYGLGTIVNDD